MNTVIAIVGATGTGKSALADELARILGGEVVSADSMQIYCGMDIGTAKVPFAERSVPYHCIDLVDLAIPYTAALYQRDARAAIDDICARGVLPIVCGGTGLYVRAALDDFVFDEQRASTAAATSLRATLAKQAEEMGAEAFHAVLARRDPASAALIHPNNVRRVVRAFEFLEQGTTYAAQHAGFSEYKAHYPTRYVGIDVAHETLYKVIDQRVDVLMKRGLLDEVRALLAAGYADTLGFSQAIGYKELAAYVQKQDAATASDLKQAVASIKQATRRYAKRQRTWFKRDERICWIDASDLHEARLADSLDDGMFVQQLTARVFNVVELVAKQ